jgi:hypothetical protein
MRLNAFAFRHALASLCSSSPRFNASASSRHALASLSSISRRWGSSAPAAVAGFCFAPPASGRSVTLRRGSSQIILAFRLATLAPGHSHPSARHRHKPVSNFGVVSQSSEADTFAGIVNAFSVFSHGDGSLLSGAEPHERRHSESADGDSDGGLLFGAEWHDGESIKRGDLKQ